MKKLSLYIHIPFCKTICVYCGFLTYANKNKFIDQYFDVLEKEIRIKAPKFKDHRVTTIYFGGGTPSLPEAEKIGMVLKSVREHFSVEKNPEITIECNPESINAEKLLAYKKMGINRISLGIQSFCRKTLWRVARPHDDADIFKALEAVKKAEIKNFGTDFIIGLPYQNLAGFKKELGQILAFKPPHLSYYFLSPDTKKIDLIKPDCPSEDEQIKMYNHLTKTLAKKGYIHYEVSNYALPGFECRHNLRYWNQEEYLGLGPGAHSYFNNECTENENDFGHYLKNPLGTADRIKLDSELLKLDYIMLQMRLGTGLDLEKYKIKCGNPQILLDKATNYLKSAHLKLAGKQLAATDKGYLIIDHITTDLL